MTTAEASGQPTTILETINTPLSWPATVEGHLWLVQPRAPDMCETPPCRHPETGASPLAMLRAAIAADAAQGASAPVFFVVPELSIPASQLNDLGGLVDTLPEGRMVIAGVGHLGAGHCDIVEPASSNASLWRGQWSPQTFANAAVVGCRGGRWLVAKDWPSKFEQDAGCHIPHRRIRVFQGHGVKFAVVICSEVLAAWNPESFISLLADQRVDLVFWLQHNPAPRSPGFVDALAKLYALHGDMPLIVAINKQPGLGKRDRFGATSLYAPAEHFGRSKNYLARPSWSAESVGGSNSVSRAVLFRYDADAHYVVTVLPRAVPRANPPGNFLREVQPHQFVNDALVRSDDPVHLRALYDAGRTAARMEAGLDGVPTPLLQTIEKHQKDVELEFEKSANLLLRFLDSALVQVNHASHRNHESHSPAAACNCWPHRSNFDSLYSPDAASQVAELLLAIAALRTACPDAAPEHEGTSRVENVCLTHDGAARRIVLALSASRLDRFMSEYFRSERAQTKEPAMIVLRAERRTRLPANAAKAFMVGSANAADPRRPESPIVVGNELWRAVIEGSLSDVIRPLVAA